MKKKLFLGFLLLMGAFLLSWTPVLATFLHAPHDAAHGVECIDCHEFHLTDEASWGVVKNTLDDTVKNFICLKCHGPGGSAPIKAMHSDLSLNGTETWSTQCTDCHSPHFQRHLSGVAGLSEDFLLSDMYLVTGIITAITPAGANTTITYTLDTAAAKWTNPASWSAKTSTDRGLIFIADAVNPKGQTFETLSADSTSITVMGVVEPAMVDKQFGLFYGQFLKNKMITGLGEQAVTFFNPYGGFVDDSGSVAPAGVCQVCHTNTIYWTDDGANNNHNGASRCTGCHSHDTGFAPSGGGDTGKHPEHLALSSVTCDTCHDITDFPYFKSGTDANGDNRFELSETDVCAHCHQDVAGNPLVGFVAGWTDPLFELECNSCHGFPPDYQNGSPKANSHVEHITNAALSCENCHFSTTTDGISLATDSLHTNGAIDVVPGTDIDFTYTYFASGGNCNTISCHGNTDATWGDVTSVDCAACHLGPGDTDNYSYNDTTRAMISTDQWTTTGHGLSLASTYTVSENNGANMSCEYCHDSGVSHGDTNNPFRLRNISGTGETLNTLCLSCHATGSVGIDPGTGNINSTIKADSNHVGTKHTGGDGGLFCWDCHDPHGDANIYMIHDAVTRQSDGDYGIPDMDASNVVIGTEITVFSNNVIGEDYAILSDLNPDKNKGICQVCHSTTGYYNPEANGHYTDKCTTCHQHSDSFAADCSSCHGFPPVFSSPRPLDGLVVSPVETGSVTAGAHEKHATDTAYPLVTDGNFNFTRSSYNFSCNTCHTDGMVTPTTADNQIQMGFAINGDDGTGTKYDGHTLLNGYTYAETSNTTITSNGLMTCENTYCHSDGTSVSSGVVPPNTSPAWDDSFPDKCPQSDGTPCYTCHIYPHPDGYSCDDCHSYPFPSTFTNNVVPYPYKCNQCHGYPPAYDNDAPKANAGHLIHGWVNERMQCSSCHYATVAGGMEITNPENHANGVYDVVPNPNIARFDYTYDVGGGKCSNIECHNSHPSINDWQTHGEQGASANTLWWQGSHLKPTLNVSIDRAQKGCREYQLSVDVDYFTIGQPNFVTPFTFSWDFGDGTTGQGNPVTHKWPDNGPYTATVTVRDSNNHPDYGSLTLDFSSDLNMYPTGGMSISMDGLTATLTDISYDPDFDCYGGDGTITINWGDGNSLSAPLGLTNTGSNQLFTHTYGAAGTYRVSHLIRDNHPISAGSSGYLYANVEAESDTLNDYITIRGTLLRDDGNYNRGLNGADVSLFDGNMDLVYFDPAADWPNRNPDTTDSNGKWGFTAVDECYTVEVEQGFGGFYETYYYPQTMQICQSDTDVPFIIDEKPNKPTTVTEKSHNNIDPDPAVRVQLEWGPLIDPPSNSPVEYQVEIIDHNTEVVGNSGWISDTFHQFTLVPDQYWSVTYFKWKVKARETVYPNRETDWSAEKMFNVYQKGNYGAGSGAGCGFQGTNYCTEDDF